MAGTPAEQAFAECESLIGLFEYGHLKTIELRRRSALFYELAHTINGQMRLEAGQRINECETYIFEVRDALKALRAAKDHAVSGLAKLPPLS